MKSDVTRIEGGDQSFSVLLMRACGVPEGEVAYALGEVDHPDESRWTPREDE